MRSRLAATIVAANFSFGIPYAAGRPSAARDDRVSCIQPIVTRTLGLAAALAECAREQMYLAYKQNSKF